MLEHSLSSIYYVNSIFHLGAWTFLFFCPFLPSTPFFVLSILFSSWANLPQVGIKPSEASDLFLAFDTDGSGGIDEKEFMKTLFPVDYRRIYRRASAAWVGAPDPKSPLKGDESVWNRRLHGVGKRRPKNGSLGLQIKAAHLFFLFFFNHREPWLSVVSGTEIHFYQSMRCVPLATWAGDGLWRTLESQSSLGDEQTWV